MHLYPRIRVVLCAALLLVIATGMAAAQGQKVTRENRTPSESERDNPRERAQWFLRGRTVNGKPAPELLHKAYQQKLNNRRLHEAARQSQMRASGTQSSTSTSTSSTPTFTALNPNFISTTTGPSWVPFGPAPSGTASVGDLDQDYGPAIGRTTVVLVDQSDSTGNTVYIGGASGGLWKSINAASTNVQNCNTVSVSQAPYCAPSVTWTPLIDQQASLTVGAMAIRPGNPQWLVVGTGEPNNSADSYYGLGILVSQDGGATWSLISSAKSADGASTIDLHGLGTTHLAFSSENIAGQNLTTSTVVATMAAAAGGLAIGAEFASAGSVTARGIYFSQDAGLSWQRATVCDDTTWSPPNPCPAASTPDTGSANAVLYNPFTHLFYANLRYHGFYSSPDGQYWTRLAVQPGPALNLAACPSTPTATSCILYRAEMAIVPGRAGANGKGEMYVWIVNNTDTNEGIYQTTNGGASWTQISTSGIDNCGDGGGGACGTTQGTYNLTLLAVPNGSAATDVYAGAVNQYRCNLDPVLNPTCGTKPFNNLTHTYGNCGTGTTGAFAHVHPDQHGIDFVQATPQLIYFGNDGGVYRTLNGFDTRTQSCTTATDPWIQFDNLSGTMGSMIQFVWFSQSPSDAGTLLGGTQDNGTMAKNTSSPATTLGNGAAAGYSWQAVNNGDGGFNDINPVTPQEWFASNPRVSIQQCINGSGITCTASTFNEFVNSSKLGGDNGPFYMAYMLDPQAATHLLAGTCRLWRVDRSANLATTWPNATALTYNLDQFNAAGTASCSTSASNMITAMAAGGPCNGTCNSGTNGSGNGSQVIYVGTNAGRVFATTNADGGVTTWADRTSGLPSGLSCGDSSNRVPCPVSGIALDPADATGNTAYVTVMGFGIGHVFKTTNAGATWTGIDGIPSGTGLPDSPADAVAVDPNISGLVYVGTDVGVFKSTGDGNWTEVGPTSGTGALPNVAITALRVFGTGANTRLRVSTYGRGIWDIPIPNVPGFQLSVTPTNPSANIGQTATLSGTITPFNGYNSAVNIQCTGVPANVTCTPSVSSVSTSSGSATFTVAVSGSAAGTYNFNITAVGTDPSVVTQQQAITLTVTVPQGLSLSTPAQASAPTGGVATTSFNLTSTNGFSGPVSLACTGLPATAGPCSFSPAIPNLSVGGTANVTVNLPTGPTVASPTPYSFTITASSPNSLPASASALLLVTVPPDFTMTAPSAVTVAAGLTGKTSFTLTANSVFSGTVTFSACSGLPANTGPCGFTPSTVTLATNQSSTVNLSIPTTASATQGSYTISITATGPATTHSQTFSLTIGPVTNSFEISNPVPFSTSIAKAGQVLSGASVSVRSPGNYSGTVSLTCATVPATTAGTCSVSPQTAVLTPGSSTTVSLSVNTFGAQAANDAVTVTASDATTGSTSDPFAYSVTDYTVTAGNAGAILPGGSTSLSLSLAAQNGYAGTVAASCNVGGAPLTCSLVPLGPYSVSGTTAVPLTATITGPGSSVTTASGNYTVTIQTSDAGFATLAHNATASVTVQDYKLQTSVGTTQTGAATVAAGQSATFTLTVVPQAGGFSGNVSFDAATVCTGLPLKSKCTVNGLESGTVPVAPGGTATLVIQTTAATTAVLHPLHSPRGPALAFWTFLPGVAAIVVLRRGHRQRGRWALLGVALLLLIVMTACGGGGGATTTTPPPIPIPGTPAGTHTITVTSTAGSGSATIIRTAQITLTVQ